MSCIMAGPPRFELGIAESKSAELPLLHEPIWYEDLLRFLYSVSAMPHIAIHDFAPVVV